ncbi:MAG: Fe2+-dependent dioxygenase [Pseudomonadota bacterium]|jgi:PKHD-type hydroxylase|uniref:Fe2+-dependent dioxygenase n=1 Tax=Aquabacterium sp. TaxID=1872578 RepID=UPI001D38DA98|nr:Fe2+-dependent dioxygenase [Aquabacterium sp.]MBT9609817.1 Fe2+-dependent dioxygenase [Aquabacterium sp.]|tara:strand:- start:498 stop:1181 length:684 start_codon:yes stop_codon:yes gene_type:complete
MLLHIPQVLTPDELQRARAILDAAPWVLGQVTAGRQAALVKDNEQLAQQGEHAKALRALILPALDRNTLFFSAALPRRIVPPLFNRYGGEHASYGKHVDNAIRVNNELGQRVRTDISATLFLANPDDYEGGDLVIDDTFGEKRVKLAAGDMVIYPGTSVHRVEPVTRGHRLASFFWIESMVRSDEQRRLLFDLDTHLTRLRQQHDHDESLVGLTGTYHNLLRMWADV